MSDAWVKEERQATADECPPLLPSLPPTVLVCRGAVDRLVYCLPIVRVWVALRTCGRSSRAVLPKAFGCHVPITLPCSWLLAAASPRAVPSCNPATFVASNIPPAVTIIGATVALVLFISEFRQCMLTRRVQEASRCCRCAVL